MDQKWEANTTMVIFEDCCNVTLEFEGGYVDDPDDPGGKTNFGITQKLVDELKLGFDVSTLTRGFDVSTLTRQGAIAFYQTQFWRLYHCDWLNDRVVATKVFDLLVNITPHALYMVQSALNTLYQSQVVAVDGELGVQTAHYINRIPDSQMMSFLLSIKLQQRAFYLEQIALRPSAVKYKNGWLRRAYWPYMDDRRPWPYLPQPEEGWPEGVA